MDDVLNTEEAQMLRQERDVLLRRYAEVQVRCSALLAERQAALDRAEADAVSYTHLTLPTNREV